MRGSDCLVLLSLLVFATACNEARSRSCTSELRSAILVTIESPQGLMVDSVTAKNSFVNDCEGGHFGFGGGIDGGSETFMYNCWEQGNGDYRVRVTSGDLVWTKTVAVDEDDDGCHVARPAQTVTFVLDPKTAD